ncbi:MAG: hypothetical protein COV60_00380 [Candidatus Magasanikbacteria bacterium CG11_big_fil_rev_8_21_14_0_20_43_7]|uniref:Uncharacterized protein n=1 Tax=Candidatus Magasanikbacteria bacterium CG11_big_fil_rev_8_21_14_0_20_43_7 TaxID=1974654 RepID=A0A2H0N3F9_9BACT|nr:MAG: hypothetical protein COV60_00380 [Candidatus Magasanikbacteria bacterium CG11_big_fil_rev_8_21_14_0_20_43_7]
MPESNTGPRPDIPPADMRDAGEPQRYFLSEEDFDPSKAPSTKEDIVDYKPGDTVSRESFISFVTESFRLSRGNVMMQNLFFLWTGLHGNFDYMRSFKSYIEGGGWNTVFSDFEKKYIAQAMMSTRNADGRLPKAHRPSRPNPNRKPNDKRDSFYRNIGSGVDNVLEDGTEMSEERLFSYYDNCETQEEFDTKLAELKESIDKIKHLDWREFSRIAYQMFNLPKVDM